MIYLLDTNTCIAYLRTPLSQVAQRLAATPPGDIALSAIVVTELFRGAYRSVQVAHNLSQVNTFIAQYLCLSIDGRVAEIAGRIDSALTGRGLRIGPYDTLIAATALTHDLTLVTHNTAEFSRIPDLRLEDWEATP